MKIKPWLIIFGILLLGFVIRAYRLSQMPMYGDELTLVYDSYSILKTGRDQTGQFLPVIFKMRGVAAGGYVYGSIPFVSIFGPSEWGVRALSVLSGLGIIVLAYFLAKKLFNQKVGLIASFLMALNPWDIYLSRGGYEAHFALFLALLGILMFLNKKYIITAFAWGLTILTYPTFKLTLPLMLLILLWYAGLKNVIRSKKFFASLAILAVFGGYVVKGIFVGGEKRFLEIGVLTHPEVKEQIVQKVNSDRTISLLPGSLRSIAYNRPVEYARVIFDNYMDNFSTRFLFLRGDGNPRNNPGEWGMFYLADIFLILTGLVYLWKTRELKFLAAWVLIVPLATMFIANAHGLRSDLMIPPLILISAFALSKFPKAVSSIFIALMLIQLFSILLEVYFLAPKKFASFWSAEAKEKSLLAITEASEGKKVVLSTLIDNVEYAYPVYARIDPNEVIAQYGKFPKIYGNVTITDSR